LLGGEQSGFIADIGFETYHKILNEAIQEIKEKEYKELLTSDDADETQIDENFQFVTSCQVDTDTFTF
jgi:transcription-repair coupling factor (superfamily II helicase)